MRLRELVGDFGPILDAAKVEITGITADSREVKPGMLFAALPGTRTDGAVYVPAAIRAGAAAILASPVAAIDAPASVAVIRDADPRARLSRLAAIFHAPQPRVAAAVTGTNGKTSVASFTEQIWRRTGLASASIGTLGVSGFEMPAKVNLTSPDPVTLHRALGAMARAGIGHVAVEASSHGLAQRRLEGVRLAGGAFTNISRDHLDYHDSFAAYFAAKLRLFREVLPRGALAAINLDGAGSDTVLAAASEAGLRVMTTGRDGNDIAVRSIAPGEGGLAVSVEVSGQSRRLDIPLVGAFQAENALLAALLATCGGTALDDALEAIGHLQGARGRLERVAATRTGGQVFVDYAHTPDAIRVALRALRPHLSGRIVIVFGAGGDRDTGKRPLMGEAAIADADLVIVTDDNPRSEDAAKIRREVMRGAPGAIEIGDRREAIGEGIRRLGHGDALLVAGKGHETGQILADRVIPFSDHEAVIEAVGSGAAA